MNISQQIQEFENAYSIEEYHERLDDKRNLILIAEFEGKPAGFKIGYEVEDSFYSWMGGVVPEFRRKKIAAGLADSQEEWCSKIGYKIIRLKTRNKHNKMLLFALSRKYQIVGFEEKDDAMESRILLEKIL